MQTRKVFQGGGLFDSSHRRRNQLETCLKKQRNVGTKTLCVYCCRATKKNVTSYEIFRKMLVRTATAHRWRSSKKKYLATVRERTNSTTWNHRFQLQATKTRCLEDMKTAAALPHCSESTKESIAGWWTLRLEMRLELRRSYGVPHLKKQR